MNQHTKPEPMPIKAVRFEEAEDRGSNRSTAATIGEVIAARYSRRGILKGALGVAAITATVSPLALAAADKARAAAATSFNFEEIEAGVDENDHVAPGYTKKVLLRWGDPIFADAPAFDVQNQSAAAQERQFGYNNDFVGILPHPDAREDANRALLVVNHEYTNEEIMFPGLGVQDAEEVNFAGMTKELVDIELAAHGGSVVEIRREGGEWSPVLDSRYNRRITATTPMRVSGPVAGHDLLKTSADPDGTTVLGTINNCAGGVTPWGTWLMAEENFNGYFWSDGEVTDENLARYGIPGKWYAWGKFYDRFNVDREANEPNRFGWVVEVDPYDPTSTPVKRTALGRMKHEGAETIVNKDGRVVSFMGDDERFDYVYRFVTAGTFNPDDRAANMNLLDEGTLSVARFNEDGTVTWIPLVFGEGELTEANGFTSQADVLTFARRAGDAVGATPMDRPEDVEPNATNGRVYVMLTNNTRRKAGDENAANPRPDNAFGHIVEITSPDGDFAADTMTWEILVQCGDPRVAEVGATFSSATTASGWFGMPDNCAIDADGRLWVTTDGNSFKATGRTDGVWAMETDGEARGTGKLFYRVPVGAEMCGPVFTRDNEQLFVAVQHPGEDAAGWPGFTGEVSFDSMPTRWPDFQDGMPARPSVVVISKDGGGKIAS
jgi:secreted PhoX family phosphatase